MWLCHYATITTSCYRIPRDCTQLLRVKIRLLVMLILVLLSACLTKGQPSGSIQQLEETENNFNSLLTLLNWINKTHEKRWPRLGGYFMDIPLSGGGRHAILIHNNSIQ